MSIYDVFNGGSKPFDKAEWAAPVSYTHLDVYKRQVRGDRVTLNNGKGVLKDREICSQRLRFTAM